MAAAEGRTSSVVFQCLETGLWEMKSKGSIPSVAISRYDTACQKRIALAEVNYLLENMKLLIMEDHKMNCKRINKNTTNLYHLLLMGLILL